jgi:hypothetical protein
MNYIIIRRDGMNKFTVLSIRVTKNVHEALKLRATKERRPITTMGRLLIEDGLEKEIKTIEGQTQTSNKKE